MTSRRELLMRSKRLHVVVPLAVLLWPGAALGRGLFVPEEVATFLADQAVPRAQGEAEQMVRAAEGYARSRPGYPPALIDWVVTEAGVTPDDPALDLVERRFWPRVLRRPIVRMDTRHAGGGS